MLYRDITAKHHSTTPHPQKGKEAKTIKLITLYLPEPYLRALDRLVNEQFYPNRAEAIRNAIRDMLTTEVWERNRNGWQKTN